MKKGHPFGIHRVLEPIGSLPQGAYRLDNTLETYDNEILLDVDMLNITSASFLRIKKEAKYDEEIIKRTIKEIVEERGKYQDPVLGSGGILIGRVIEIGNKLAGKINLQRGAKVATMVSLTATPLKIDRISKINLSLDQVWVEGKAIIFERGLFARLPDDLPLEVSLAVMDVAGAPAMVAKSVKAGDNVLVMGGGKAGLLCLHEAKKRIGKNGKLIAIRLSPHRCQEIVDLGLADEVMAIDVTKPIAVMEAVERVTDGKMADFTVNVVNVDNSEMASILSTKDDGLVFFYNMGTNFAKAALGAESVGKPVQMLIGNGYIPGHAELTFDILRENVALRKYFQKNYTKV